MPVALITPEEMIRVPGPEARILREAGFDVEVLADYRSPAVHIDLPGWYVVEAHKPA